MRQPTWNRYEIALLIDAYIQIHDKGASKQQVLRALSNALRDMAIYCGVEIDDAYRNMNGMVWQYGFIEKAFQESGYDGRTPPKLFMEGVRLYKHEQQAFATLLREAQLMCIKDAWAPTYTKQIEFLLSEHYSYGFRLGLAHELHRLRNLAAGEHIALPASDEELQREIEAVGMTIDGKVHVLQEEVQERLSRKIETIFASGVGVIFLECLYEKESDFFEDCHVLSAEILKEILRQLVPAYYYGKNIVTPGKRKTEVDAILEEVDRISCYGSIVAVDALIENLIYIPAEKIVWALSCSDNMVRIAEGKYYRAADFIISDADAKRILAYAKNACDSHGSVALADIPLGNLAEENYELTAYGLQKAVYAAVLKKDFLMQGTILVRNGEKQNLQSVLRKFCLDRAACTVQEVQAKMEELGSTSGKAVALQVLFDTMVRVDRDRFVADRQLAFRIEVIDSLLSEYIGDRFTTIQSVPTFAFFPTCGSPWNYSLLESYCYRFSSKYRLSVKDMNSKNAGFIASATCPLSYHEMLCESAAKADVELTPDALASYFFENGCTASRRYAGLPEVIAKAKKIREEGE